MSARRDHRPDVTSMLASLALMLVLVVQAHAEQAAGNQLRDHPSPYLALHGNDPVAWQDWSEAVLDRARAENKLVLLSVGYFSCHWCHVMQRESYQDPEVAALLNEAFIPVKIDRELEEALDDRLITFAEETRGRAGWPLNVFLTPEGRPLFATLYEPRERFLAILRQLQALWRDDPAALRRLVAQEADQPEILVVHAWQPGEVQELASALQEQALALADPLHGGFGEQQKFPSVPQLRVLLARQRQHPEPQLAAFLTTTLDEMARRGLYDHVGGGFFRYTVDPDWHTPHFEKMLYDNALLARLYLEAAGVLGRPDWREITRQTLDFMLREMATPDGMLVAALSALDDSGVEGGYYTWRRDELSRLLDVTEYAAVDRLWLASGAGPFAGGHLPFPREDSPGETPILAGVASKLLAARQGERGIPVDDKRLAGWNGLALTTFATAAGVFGDDAYRAQAQRIRDDLLAGLWDGQRLWRARYDGRPLGQASLADYAYVAEGLWAWYGISGEAADLAQLLAVLDAAWRRYSTAAGWVSGETGLPDGPRVPAGMDGPMPASSAVLLEVTLAAAAASGRDDLMAQARQALGWGAGQFADNPYLYASHIGLLAAYATPAARP